MPTKFLFLLFSRISCRIPDNFSETNSKFLRKFPWNKLPSSSGVILENFLSFFKFFGFFFINYLSGISPEVIQRSYWNWNFFSILPIFLLECAWKLYRSSPWIIFEVFLELLLYFSRNPGMSPGNTPTILLKIFC